MHLESTSATGSAQTTTRDFHRQSLDSGPRIRILVVDDHVIFRKLLVQLLQEMQDHEVVGDARDGQEAVEMALLLRPDVVIMDMEMPRLNGIEATRKIKSLMPDIRIIGTSMHPRGEEAEAWITEAGAAHYHPKTEPVEELLAAIRG